jgi:cellobiose-specific phosphotransferase system component IIC
MPRSSLPQLVVTVVVSFVLIVVVAGLARFALALAFDPAGPPRAGHLTLNIMTGMIAAGIGGYLCARRAPEGRVTIAAALLLVLFLVVGMLSGRTAATPIQPLWYQSLMTLLGASGLLTGAVIGASRRAQR